MVIWFVHSDHSHVKPKQLTYEKLIELVGLLVTMQLIVDYDNRCDINYSHIFYVTLTYADPKRHVGHPTSQKLPLRRHNNGWGSDSGVSGGSKLRTAACWWRGTNQRRSEQPWNLAPSCEPMVNLVALGSQVSSTRGFPPGGDANHQLKRGPTMTNLYWLPPPKAIMFGAYNL